MPVALVIFDCDTAVRVGATRPDPMTAVLEYLRRALAYLKLAIKPLLKRFFPLN